MGLRQEIGGKIEEAIDKAIDEQLSAEKLTALVVPMFTKLINEQLEGLKAKVKANYVDLIDGEDDIPNV